MAKPSRAARSARSSGTAKIRKPVAAVQSLPPLSLILGVHRSGTSLLALGLAALGADLGDFNDAKDLDNPDGYAEHPKVRVFNDRLLAHLGASWDNWGFRASSVDFGRVDLLPWRAEAVEILRAAFDGPGPFVLKDPRCATLLPFWEIVIPAAGFDLRRILILRDPVEVAESQMQRVARRPNEFPVIAAAESMAALWSVTMQGVLATLSDDRTLLLHHADLHSAPATTLAAAATFAGCAPSAETLSDFAKNGVKTSLYRARAADAPPATGEWMTAARTLFKALPPSGSPRPLPQAEARRIAAAQTQLLSLMQGLEAARESIFRMLSVQSLHKTQQQVQVAELTALLWALNSLIQAVPVGVVSALANRIETNTPSSSFVATYIKGQLLIRAEATQTALQWLNAAQERFGHIEAFKSLVNQLETQPVRNHAEVARPRTD